MLSHTCHTWSPWPGLFSELPGVWGLGRSTADRVSWKVTLGQVLWNDVYPTLSEEQKSCNPFRFMHIHHDLGIMSLVSFVSFCRWILQCMDALVCFSQVLFICLFACYTCFNHCRWTLWNPHDDVSLHRHGWTPWFFDSCPRSTNIIYSILLQ